jgi:hypothetical protein
MYPILDRGKEVHRRIEKQVMGDVEEVKVNVTGKEECAGGRGDCCGALERRQEGFRSKAIRMLNLCSVYGIAARKSIVGSRSKSWATSRRSRST